MVITYTIYVCNCCNRRWQFAGNKEETMPKAEKVGLRVLETEEVLCSECALVNEIHELVGQEIPKGE